MAEDVVLVEIADRVATVTLNRPAVRNALNAEMRRALPGAIGDLDADDEVDVIILTGADPAFCAGLDLKELGASAGGAPRGAPVVRPTERGLFPAHSVPIIGAVNGVTVTGGFEIALGCDLLVASERARFADTHARVGIMPDWGLTVLLPSRVGTARARQLSLTGNFIDAQTALAWGLVNHVVAHDELLPFCRSMAADIVSNDQRAVRRILATYRQGSELSGEQAWALEKRVAAEWAREGGGDLAEVERRRQAIVDRGRAQARPSS